MLVSRPVSKHTSLQVPLYLPSKSSCYERTLYREESDPGGRQIHGSNKNEFRQASFPGL